MDFKAIIKEYQDIINNELEKYVITNECPEKLLNESMAYSLMAGGKRLRPILILQTYKLFKNDYEKCFPFVVATEMIHNFSLIHDDLPAIDDDDLRHGKLTNHKKFNEATAILAGDGLLNSAYMLISKDLLNTTDIEEQRLKIKAFNELSMAIDRVIAGEYVDTEFEGKEISNEYLEYMHKNKTGEFLKASARIGAILAGAKEEEIDVVSKYAEKIGLTFQIRDDILSEIGDKNILGKPVGNDKEKGKCTYVTKYGLERAQQILDNLTNEAIELANRYNENGEFFKEFAIYIKNREK